MKDTAQGVFRFRGTASPFTDYDLIGDLIGLPADTVAERLASYDLRTLGTLSEQELKEAGLTPARARRLHRAFELARRYGNGKRLPRGEAFANPRQIYEAFHLRLRDERREIFLVVLLDARHRIIREEVVSVGENELVHITAGKPEGDAGSRQLDLRGYEPVDIPVQLVPLQQWPKARQVVLTPDSSEAPAVPHRVVFPKAELPQGWRDDPGRLLEIIAGATIEEGSVVTTYFVNQAHPVFRMPRGKTFRFQLLAERGPRQYRLRDEGDAIKVLVEWPHYAFLDLRFPLRHPEFPAATSTVAVWSDATASIHGRLVRPGHARFAYLPEGSYTAEVYWWKGGSHFASWRLRAPFPLTMGLHALRLEDGEFQAKSSR